MSGAYARASREEIAGTLRALRHYREFIRSPYARMIDPFDRDGGALDKAAAQSRLTWLTRIAILRKSGWIEDRHSREHAPSLNHRGRFQRNRTGDAQRHLRQLADRINQPRLIVRERELGEWREYLIARIPHRITRKEEDT